MPIEQTEWIIISELPRKEAFATTNRASVIIPLVVLALMIIATFIFRNIFLEQILAPLNQLQRGTFEISQGNLSHRIEILRNDELGKVMAGFNAMTSDLEKQQSELQRYADELEARVQERTTELMLANENLSKEVHEKEILLKEIHHRVKNNLQVISSLFNLQAGQVRETGTLQILRDSQTRVRSMALIHEKLYQSKNLARIDFGEYVQSLATDLFRSYQRTLGGIQLKVQVDEVYLDLDQAIPCGLILNELVTNALKYAFPGGREGTIRVELHNETGNMVTLRVMDDGIGLPNDLDVHTTKTLGWQLINSLVAQLDGRLEIDNTHGTNCGVSFGAGLDLS
jgi:two-component sensor histidine kinase